MVVASDGHEENPKFPQCLEPRSRPPMLAAQTTILNCTKPCARAPVSPSHPLDLLFCVSDALPLTPFRRTSCSLTRDTTICQLKNHQNDGPICSWECGHLWAVGATEVWARAKTTSIPHCIRVVCFVHRPTHRVPVGSSQTMGHSPTRPTPHCSCDIANFSLPLACEPQSSLVAKVGFGQSHPFAPPPPVGPPPSGPSPKQQIGQMRSGQIPSTKIGQIRPNKDGQMRPSQLWPNVVLA